MAANNETIIIDVKVDADKVKAAMESVTDSISQLRQQQRKLIEDFEKGKISQGEYATATQKIKDETKQLEATQKSYAQQLQVSEKASKAMGDSMREQAAQLNRLKDQYRSLDKQQRESEGGKKMLQEIQRLDAEVKNAEAGIGNFQRNVGNYQSALLGMTGANRGLIGTLMQSAAGADTAGKAFNALKGNVAAMGKQMITLAMNPVIAVIAGIAAVVKVAKDAITTSAEFEAANSKLASVLGTTADGVKKLEENAKELGRTTNATAAEVTALQTELAKLGFSQDQILNMTEPVLKFAKAVDTDLASAASTAGAVMRMFGADAEETERYLAAMAVATTKSAMSFSDLETGMSTIGPVANAFGLELEDTLTLFGALKNAGFDASSAATAARNIILNFADDNGKLATAIGHPIKNMQEMVGAFQSLSAAGVDLATTLELTDKRSVAAFNAFLNQSDSLMTLRGAIGDADGKLNEMYDTMTNNVKGSVDRLKSAWEGLMLQFSGSTSVVKPLIDMSTELLGAVANGIQTIKNLYKESAAFRGIVQAIGVTCKSVVEFSLTQMRIVRDVVTNLFSIIDGLFTFDTAKIKSGIKGMTHVISDNFKEMGKTMASAAKTAWEKTKNPPIEVAQEVASEQKEMAEGAAVEEIAITKKKTKEEIEAEKKAVKEYERLLQERIKAAEAAAKNEKDINKLVEDFILTQIEDEGQRKIAARKLQGEREIAALQERLDKEENLTAESREKLAQLIKDKQAALDAEIEQMIVDDANARFDVEVEKERERAANILALKIELAEDNSEEELALKLEQLQAERDQQLENDELTAEERLLIQEKYEQKSADLTAQYEERKRAEVAKATEFHAQQMNKMANNAKGAFDALANLLDAYAEDNEEAAKASKAFSMMSVLTSQAITIADTAKGITAAVAGAAEAAAAGGPLAPVLIAAYTAEMVGLVLGAVASTAGNIASAKNILKQADNVKFATGGIVPGRYDAQDSVRASLSGGEMVLNPAQQKTLFDIANTGATVGFNYELLGATMAAAVASQPAPVMQYSEFQDFTNRVATYKEFASV